MKSNKIIQILLIIVVLTTTNSCREGHDLEDNSIQSINIDNNSITDEFDISNSIEDVQLIPVREADGNYVVNPFKLLFTKSNYIIFDKFQSQKVNLFDSSGLLIKTLIKPGDGPNDALQINDCWVDGNGIVEAYDFAQKKVYRFDSLFNLSSVTKSQEQLIFANIRRIPKSKDYAAYATFNEFNPPQNGQLYHFAILDENLNIKKTDLYFDKSYQGIEWLSLKNHFFQFNDSLRFVEALSNFVSDVTMSGIHKKYQLVYTKKPLPNDILDKIMSEHLEEFKNREIPPAQKFSYLSDYSVFNGLWLENNKYVFLTSRQSKDFIFITILTKSDMKAIVNTKKLSETVRYKLSFPPFEYYNSYNKCFVNILTGAELENFLSNDSPFKQVVNSNPEGLFILNVKFKDEIKY